MGQYQASWEAGLHFKVPFFNKVVKKVSLKEKQKELADKKIELDKEKQVLNDIQFNMITLFMLNFYSEYYKINNSCKNARFMIY